MLSRKSPQGKKKSFGRVHKRTSRKRKSGAGTRVRGDQARLNPPLDIKRGAAKQEVLIGNTKLNFSNLNKPFWPRPRISKRQMIDYYYQVAPFLLPHLKDRPLTMKRYPAGFGGAGSKFFYQKNVPKKHPSFVKTLLVRHQKGPVRYVLVNNVETLLWLANLADLEIHPWYSRKGSLNRPDYVVFDLDPSFNYGVRPGPASKPADIRSRHALAALHNARRGRGALKSERSARGPGTDLKKIRTVALLIKDVLADLGLVSFAKSSGSRGIHLYVPIKNKFSYEKTRLFAKRVSERVNALAPELTTLEFSKARRHGVYIDYLQNVRGKTLASPYSLRARPGAPVAAPLTWAEVKKGYKIADFNIKTVPARLRTRGDLFAQLLTIKQDLGPAIKKLGNR